MSFFSNLFYTYLFTQFVFNNLFGSDALPGLMMDLGLLKLIEGNIFAIYRHYRGLEPSGALS